MRRKSNGNNPRKLYRNGSLLLLMCLYVALNISFGRNLDDHGGDLFVHMKQNSKDFSIAPVPSLETDKTGSQEDLNKPVPVRRQLQSVKPTQVAVEDANAAVETKKEVQVAGHSAQNKSDAYFMKQGNKFYVTSREALNLQDYLPPDTYTIGMDMSGYYLQKIDSFEIGGKVYGETQKHSDRILRTFLDRSGSTGVLMSGDKGSGKTFLAKFIAVQAAQKYGIPTVVVNQPLHGEQFNTFVQSISQPAIFLFDEYEKIYAGESDEEEDDRYRFHHGKKKKSGSRQQDSMLTLLDGTYSSKRLFLLTTNDKYRVAEQMRNRPGRIFYVIDFAGLSPAFVREYCEDKLKDKSKIPQVISLSSLYGAFSFDMLKGMVEDMNRYNETPEEVLKYLNVRPEFVGGNEYKVKLFVDDKEVPQRNFQPDRWFGNPLGGRSIVVYYHWPRPSKIEKTEDADEDEFDEREEKLEFATNELESFEELPDGDGSYGFVYYKENKKARLLLIQKDDTQQERTTTILRLAAGKKKLGSNESTHGKKVQ